MGRLAAFDIESTGVDPEQARIVTAALTIVGADHPTEYHSWIADPGIEIPEEAAKIHGYTTERVRAEGQPAADVVDEIAALVAEQLNAVVPIVAMNASYDLTVLDRECRRHGLATVQDRCNRTGPVIDPFVMDKAIDRYRKGKRTLTALCEHYGVKLGDDAHQAGADALAAARVAYKLAVRFPALQVDLADLFVQQQVWAAEQAASLQEYFRRQPGRENETVDGSWPLRPFPTAVAGSGRALPQ
jgi:DNA polymerase-3 subunit epsilon